jgi:hypothetical protein
MPEHHVYLDERNFFSRYLHGERLKAEKESLVEAYSKWHTSLLFLKWLVILIPFAF